MNQYHIYEAIGRGKHSTVYKGRKKKTIEYYAIKSVEKSQKQKVLQEVRTLHSLDHPNVLKFYAWYETSAHLWLVLEYCVGGDLLTLLRQDSRLPEESIHDFARDLVQALQFLHSKGVIYCDLKPSNILLDENGRLKLCDFGLARRLSDISKNSVSQLPQAKRGTPCYMAPELFREGGVHSYASDLWALGCVLYECYSGRPPFVANEFTQLVKSIISDPTPPLHNSASEELSDLVNRLLVKDPAERIQWAELREHAFWKSTIKTLSLPAQPAFSNLVQLSSKVAPAESCQRSAAKISNEINNNLKNSSSAKGLNTPTKDMVASENKQSHRKKGTTGVAEDMPLKEAFAKANVGVNLLRLSKIVKTNLQKETEGENYRKASSKACDDDDVKIENHDQELNFAENVEGDQHDEIESSEALGSTTPISEEKASQNGHLTHELQNNENGISHNASPENSDIESNSMQLEHQEVAATPPGVGLQRRAQRPVAIAAEMGKRTLPSSAAVDPSTVTMHLSQALWHPSDLSVKPIMFSRKSDKASDHTLDPRMLPFEMLSPADFIKLPPEELDSVINRIVSTLGSNTSINEKQNMLKYIETFCGNVDAANVLINGPIMPLMLKMLRISKSSALRIQLVCVIGLLIRHATIIGDELAGTGIISVLTDALRDKQERIRRFAMAALGELLFYVSTQSDSYTRTGIQESPVKEGRGSSGPWQIPSALIGLISSILRIGEDDATQLYALKTIENIASQGGDWALRFSSTEVICNLCYIFRATGKHESLRLTAGSCLVRLLRFSPSNIQLALEKTSFKDLVSGLSKGNQREQQISINLINMALLGSHTISNMSRHLLSLQEEKTFVPSLVSLLEQATEVLRGKSFVCAALLCKTSRRWLPLLCNTKVLIAMERLAKEKDVYVQQCIEALVQTVGSIVPSILDSVNSDIRSLCNGKRSGQLGTPQGGRSHARNSLHLFPVVFHLFNSPVIKNRIASTQILQQLAFFMKYLEAASFQGKEDFQSNLLRIFELVGQEQSILLQNADIYISQVLPSLAVLYRTNTDADARFLCLKILFDALVVFLNDISDSPSSSKETRAKDLKLISEKHFLTLYPTLILDEDPMPIYAQKLLVMLLDLNCITIADILQLKLLSQFFDFLSDDLSNANVNDIKLCLLLVSSPKVSTQTLSELRVVGRIGTLLKFVTAREMEDFLEPTLCVCKSLLIRSSRQSTLDGNFRLFSEETVKLFDIVHKEASIQDINEFGSYITIFLELCGYHESNVANCASECLVLALNVTEKASMHVLLNTPNFTKVLELFLRRQNQISSSHIQRRILYTLKVAMKEQLAYHTNYYPVSKSETIRLQTVLSSFKNSKDLHVAEAASGVILELESLS